MNALSLSGAEIIKGCKITIRSRDHDNAHLGGLPKNLWDVKGKLCSKSGKDRYKTELTTLSTDSGHALDGHTQVNSCVATVTAP